MSPRVQHPVSSPDWAWAAGVLEAFSADGPQGGFFAVLDGEPHAKMRPRFNRSGGAYQDPDDKLAEERTGWLLVRAGASVIAGNAVLACRFYRAAAGRVDADNLLKHVADAANGILWKDDCQATLMIGEIRMDRARPRTIVAAGRHASTMRR